MVARFSSHKAMVFAYSDLLAMGLPPTAVRPRFDETVSAPQPPEEHNRFMQRLHEWFQARRSHSSMPQGANQAEPERPTAPAFKASEAHLKSTQARGGPQLWL